MKDYRWLIWPDTHIPYHDKAKVTKMFRVLKEWKPDRLTFLGDLDDMKAPSRFAQGTPDEWKDRLSITTETDTSKFLRDIREEAPDAEIDYFEGNHEKRLIDYVSKKAPALDGLVSVPKILGLDNLGIKWYPYMDKPTKLVNDFYVYHGSSISKYAGQSGRQEHESLGVSGFSGHTHRLASYRVSYLDREASWFECGHLSDIKQQNYSQHFNWQHGFGYAYVDGKNVWPGLAEFKSNKVYLDGVLF